MLITHCYYVTLNNITLERNNRRQRLFLYLHLLEKLLSELFKDIKNITLYHHSPTSIAMGRRVRSNCSPIDSAMEKYHSDIGNRLSGVFMPPNPQPQSGLDQDDCCDAFSMLTLDFRRTSSMRVAKTTQTNTATTTTTNTRTFHDKDATTQTKCIDSALSNQHRDDSPFDQRSNTLSSVNFQLGNISSIKEKRNFMDKLARALFQRKHTCARCQRRSKSCLQNKTFNVSEKHYMCPRCREANRAMKSLISGQDPVTGEDNAKNNPDVILPKPRLEAKDSGYDTVTSCSTVSSSHSNFNSPYASSNKQTTATAAVVDGVTRRESPGHDISTTPCPDSNNTNPNPATSAHHHQAGQVHQFMGGARDNNGVPVLKQVKTRHVQNYDGYLPNQQTIPPHLCDLLALSDHTLGNNVQLVDTATDHSGNISNSNVNNNTAKSAGKVCYVCSTSSRPCFRLPWEDGWLCEDCIDGML